MLAGMVGTLSIPSVERAFRAWFCGLLAGLCGWAGGLRIEARAGEAPRDKAARVELAGAAPMLFGFLAVETGRPEDIRQMRAFTARLAHERAAIAACLAEIEECPNPAAQRWSREVAAARTLPRAAAIRVLNTAINRLKPHVSDAAAWGVSDYWAAPLEFLARDGDCEDFTLLKYVSLAAIGVPEEAMRVVVAMDLSRDLPHAFLVVASGGRALVLDTSFDDVRADTRIAHYRPHYALNLRARWGFVGLRPAPATVVAANDNGAPLGRRAAP